MDGGHRGSRRLHAAIPARSAFPASDRSVVRACRNHLRRFASNRRPAERLFVDYAGMTVLIPIDGLEHQARVFVPSMGVSGRIYAEATLIQKIEDSCASHVRCFEDIGWVPQLVVPDNIKPAVIEPSRYDPVLNETYADLLEHYGVQGFPPRATKPRDKALLDPDRPAAEQRPLPRDTGRITCRMPGRVRSTRRTFRRSCRRCHRFPRNPRC